MSRMKEIIKGSLASVWQHRKIYIKGLLFLSVIQGVIFLPILGLLFNQLLRIAGLQSITETTITAVLTNPFALVMLGLVALLAIIAIYFELGFFFLVAQAFLHKKPLVAKTIVRQLLKRVGAFLSFQLLFFLGYLVLLLPLASIGVQSMLTESLRLPYFIADELFKSTTGTLVYVAVMLLVFYISMRLIFTLPIFVLNQKKTVLAAMKASWFASQGNVIKSVVALGSLLIGYNLLLGAVSFLLLMPIFFVESVSLSLAPWVAGVMLTIIQVLFVSSFGLIQAVMAEATIRLGGELPVSDLLAGHSQTAFFSKPIDLFIRMGVGVVILITLAGNLIMMKEGLYHPSTIIIAHRGETSQAIENTLSALVAAAEIKADFVELDVMETKDKQLIVFHDDTLRRLANRNEAIKDLTLAEIKEVVLSSGGKTDRIPTFSEFIDTAKSHQIKLLVEIKLHGSDSSEMVTNVVDILAEKGVSEDYLVQSLNERIVTEVKAINPQIKTGYLVAFNVGNLPDIPADFLVLEDFSVNQRLLNQAREQNKTIFVWTVNKESLMRDYLRIDIDGMITNQPKRALELRQSFEEEKRFSQRVRGVIN